jgi:hypothetical protein
MIEPAGAENRRNPYRITAFGEKALRARLASIQNVARVERHDSHAEADPRHRGLDRVEDLSPKNLPREPLRLAAIPETGESCTWSARRGIPRRAFAHLSSG